MLLYVHSQIPRGVAALPSSAVNEASRGMANEKRFPHVLLASGKVMEERRRRPSWQRRRGSDARVGNGRGRTMPGIIERLRCAKVFSLLVLIPGAQGNPLYHGSSLLISVSSHLVS